MRFNRHLPELFADFENVYQWFSLLSDIAVNDPSDTIHIVVDMINGFVKKGALASKEVCSINDDIASLISKCKHNHIKTLALADMHSENSTEFETYPVHCLKGTEESELTDEIKNADNHIIVFGKNSTNGYLEPDFCKELLHSGKHTFILTGDCTDMCVMQLALTIKADFNRRNISSRVIVPYELTATCSLPDHAPELAEMMALYMMKTNGIEIVKNIIL